jgi:hypothetical protein
LWNKLYNQCKIKYIASNNVLLNCKTPDFHRKPESLYHRDSPWISGYRVQNVSQITTQSHSSHHIRVKVHNLLHAHCGLHHYKPLGWIRVKFYATVASISEGSPFFILLATCILERSNASLSRTIHWRCWRTRTRTLHTQSLSPRSGIGPCHQLYVALSGLTSKGRKRETRKWLRFPMQQQQSIIKISPTSSQPQSSQHSSEPPGHPGPRLHNLLLSRVDARNSSHRTSMIAIESTRSIGLSPLTDCNHGSPYTHI